MMPMEHLQLEREVVIVLNQYAQLCDAREWSLMDQIFSPNATAQYGDRVLANPTAILAMLRDNLGGCGPTQHLLGNLSVDATPAGDGPPMVVTRIAVRASHCGAGENRHETYECMGHYKDMWCKTENGWRIAHRTMVVAFEFGNRKVLRPASSVVTV